MPATRLISVKSALLGALLLSLFLWLDVRLAQRKLFWLDEAYSQQYVCPQNYFSMAIQGANGEGSPVPLYHLIEKAVIENVSLDSSILVTYRALSLAAGISTILLLFFVLSASLGTAPALFSVFLLLNQPIFHQYSAENRPYLLWVFFSTALLLYTARLYSKEPTPSPKQTLGLAVIGLLNTVTSGGGMIQSAAAAMSFPVTRKKGTWGFAILLCVIFAAVGTHYMSSASADHFPGPYNLLETKDLRLIVSVLALLIPKGGFLFNPWVIFGLLYSIWALIRKLRGRLDGPQFVESLGIQVLVQLTALVLIGALVAIKGYYFVPKIFIFLTVCRACLGAVGLSVAWEWAFSRIPPGKLRRVAYPGLTLGLLGLVLAKTVAMDSVLNSMYPAPSWSNATFASCTPNKYDIALWSDRKSAREATPNTVARLSAASRNCAILDSEGTASRPLKNILIHADGQTLSELPTSPLPTDPMIERSNICGHEVTLKQIHLNPLETPNL